MRDPLELLNSIWRMIFPGQQLDLSISEFEAAYCADLPLPLFTNSLWNTSAIAVSKPYGHAVSQSELEERSEELQDTPGASGMPLPELLNRAFGNLVFSGDNHYNCEAVLRSDNIFKSREVYGSRSIHDSQKVIFSANSIGLDSAAACDSSGYSQFVIRAIDSINCSRCLDIYQSGRCSGCLFVSNCYDVHDCILCTNLRSKRFCIGNMQFSEEEYRDLRPQIEAALVFNGFNPMYKLAGAAVVDNHRGLDEGAV
ncbi:MAG: hypothetical protein K1X83_12820 [Oligoflexia bacterium]|nr:hypothetical protein [Oligoflexia bacterium]